MLKNVYETTSDEVIVLLTSPQVHGGGRKMSPDSKRIMVNFYRAMLAQSAVMRQ